MSRTTLRGKAIPSRPPTGAAWTVSKDLADRLPSRCREIIANIESIGAAFSTYMYSYQRDQIPSQQIMQGLCDSSFHLEGHLLELYGQVKNLSGRERERAGGDDVLSAVRKEMGTLFNMLEPYRAGITKVRYGEEEEVEDAREISLSRAHCAIQPRPDAPVSSTSTGSQVWENLRQEFLGLKKQIESKSKRR